MTQTQLSSFNCFLMFQVFLLTGLMHAWLHIFIWNQIAKIKSVLSFFSRNACFIYTSWFFQRFYQYLVNRKLVNSSAFVILSLFYGLVLFYGFGVVFYNVWKYSNWLDISLFKSLFENLVRCYLIPWLCKYSW